MTEAILSHLEFLGPELSKLPVPEKLGWLSPVVLSALSSGCAGFGRQPWKPRVLWVREREWALPFPTKVCPFLKPNTQVLHLSFDGQDLMSWGFPWGFFPPVQAETLGSQ